MNYSITLKVSSDADQYNIDRAVDSALNALCHELEAQNIGPFSVEAHDAQPPSKPLSRYDAISDLEEVELLAAGAFHF